MQDAVDMSMGVTSVRPSFKHAVLVHRYRAIIPPMALVVTIGGDERCGHRVLMAARYELLWRARRWVPDDLRLRLEPDSGLVGTGLGLGMLNARLHRLPNLVGPRTGAVARRGRRGVVDFKPRQPTMEAHIPLWHVPAVVRDIGGWQQRCVAAALLVKHHWGRRPGRGRQRLARSREEGVDPGKPHGLLLGNIVVERG